VTVQETTRVYLKLTWIFVAQKSKYLSWSYVRLITSRLRFFDVSEFLRTNRCSTWFPILAVTDAVCFISPHELVNLFKLCSGMLPTLIHMPVDGRHMWSYKSASVSPHKLFTTIEYM